MNTRGILLLVLLIPVAYIASIFWRVSVAEKTYFGHSDLIPLSTTKARYTEPAVPGSYGATRLFIREGKPIHVWRQKVNGFQHVYGSALVAYELGEKPADWLFCANEWAEAFLDWDGIHQDDFQDRHKDLHHNKLGRGYARAARQTGQTTTGMAHQILADMEAGNGIILHRKSPRVRHLPSERALGCPNLPTQGPFLGLFGNGLPIKNFRDDSN